MVESWAVAKSVVRCMSRFLRECVAGRVFTVGRGYRQNFKRACALRVISTTCQDFVVCFTMITTVNKNASMIGRGKGSVVITIMCVVQSGWAHQNQNNTTLPPIAVPRGRDMAPRSFISEGINHSLWSGAEPVCEKQKKVNMESSWSVRMKMTCWVENQGETGR